MPVGVSRPHQGADLMFMCMYCLHRHVVDYSTFESLGWAPRVSRRPTYYTVQLALNLDRSGSPEMKGVFRARANGNAVHTTEKASQTVLSTVL